MKIKQSKLDNKFLQKAKRIAAFSKDKEKKVGCIIIDENNFIIGTGINCVPNKIKNSKKYLLNSEYKHHIVLHAEINAIFNATKSTKKCTAYIWPIPPCARCASVLIKAGIKRIVSPPPITKNSKWIESTKIAIELFHEANIEVYFKSI